MRHRIVCGDLLDQPVDAIVNSWNRNVIPWWLLLPQGVSGAIKKRGGPAPFRELSRHGVLPLGGAVLTGAGRLPFQGIIHVAGINLLWRASEPSIRLSVRSACEIAERERFATLALPIIGAGSGGFDEEIAASIILHELDALSYETEVLVVRYRKTAATQRELLRTSDCHPFHSEAPACAGSQSRGKQLATELALVRPT